MPFGPEISWPYGFRQLDPEYREVLESAYGAPDRIDPRYPSGDNGAGTHGYAYQQPAIDDHGYGDPGYSDPSYDGPRSPYTGPAFPGGSAFPAGGGPRTPGGPGRSGGFAGQMPGARVPGYHVPGNREPSGPEFGYQRQDFAVPSSGPSSGPSSVPQDIYPVTGAQEALPDTGPQPVAGPGAAYPEQWYGHPRLDDRVVDEPRYDSPRAGFPPLDGPRPSGRPAADPRLEGMRYDELHYDEPGGPDNGEPLDDESWYAELRRSAPAYPHRPGDQQRPADPQRRADPLTPAHGQQPGYPQGPAAERAFGYGPGHDGTGPGSRNGSQPDAGGGPWMTARPQTGADRQTRPPGTVLPQDLAPQGTGFLGAPTARVGVLTPPGGTPVEDQPGDGPLLAGPSASEFFAPANPRRQAQEVRPGHGLDGPEITSSWPALPPSDELDSFDEFWQTDDGEGNNRRGLFGDDAEHDDAEARPGAKRGTGRRRGRSNDHRLWLALGTVVITAAAAIVGIIKFEFPSHGGPVHAMATPDKIGAYARTVDLERQTQVAKLRDDVIKMSSGQASQVVSAVYQSGNSAAGGTAQIVMFIGGHLANAAPAASITSFTQRSPGAMVVSAGSAAGEAACVQEGAATSNGVSMCVWFDNDSFGEVVSPTMNATALANLMRTIRPSVELVVKK